MCRSKMTPPLRETLVCPLVTELQFDCASSGPRQEGAEMDFDPFGWCIDRLRGRRDDAGLNLRRSRPNWRVSCLSSIPATPEALRQGCLRCMSGEFYLRRSHGCKAKSQKCDSPASQVAGPQEFSASPRTFARVLESRRPNAPPIALECCSVQ